MLHAMSRRGREERGTVLVLVALAMVALLTLAAIAVDISMLRSDLRANRGAADAASTAAALDLTGSAGAPATACAHAWDITLRNLGIDPTTATSPCTSTFPTGAACSPSTPAQAVGTASGVAITITIPVIDSSPLMSAQMIGGDQAQAITARDGSPCERVGIQIQRTRSSTFGGIVGRHSSSTTVHSVARYSPATSGSSIPALVALNKTACPSIDANSGTIHVYNAGAFPGIIDNDSNATAVSCSLATTFNAGTSGTITADPGTTGTPGQLGYSAPSQSAAFPSAGIYVGTKTYEAPITRSRVDAVYHCGNVSPLPTGCTTGVGGTDAISDLQSRYASMTALTAGAAGFTVFPTGVQSCLSIPASFAAGNWFINCPTFSLTSSVSFTSGNIVFAGNISLGSHALLTINAANASTTAPLGADSTVVIQSPLGITTSSNTWQINWYRTTVVMTSSACQVTIVSCGTIALQNGGGTWTAPQAGGTKGLIYWSETSQRTTFQGNPTLTWNGVFFAGSSLFDLQGNAVVDASNVQLWVDSAALHNSSAQLLLKPDPTTGLTTQRAGSSLIR
jgi:hypothetical protein